MGCLDVPILNTKFSPLLDLDGVSTRITVLINLPLMQGEREYVGRRRWNGSAASALERADHFGIGIAQDRREALAVALDIDCGDELVVAPNLPPDAARHCGGDRKVHYVVCWNWVARRRRQDGQADFIVWTDICIAVLDAVEQHDRLPILLRDCLQTGALKKLGRSVQVGQEGGDKALNVEIADWQWALCSVAEDAPLQFQIE